MTDYKMSTYGMKTADFETVFAAIMRNSKDGLFITDHEGTIMMVNRATEKMVEFEVSKILGRNVREMVDAGYYDKSVALEVIRTKQPISMI
jgi:PAS domain S-box-containing protein